MTAHYRELLQDGHLAVFLFHGVIEETEPYAVRNYTRKHLPAPYFADLIESLRMAGTPVSMDDVVRMAVTGEPPKGKAYAITFDDGFENNFSVARPILERNETPATFYLTTGFIQDGTMSWVDRIEQLLETTHRGVLRLPWMAEPWKFSGPSECIAVMEAIRGHVKTNPRIDRDALVVDLAAQLGREPTRSSDLPLDRKMSWEQAAALARHPLFLVGGHTHSHAILSFLREEGLTEELDVSMALLRRHLGFSPTHYSYPEGQAQHYSPAVVAALKARGILCCPTAIEGINNRIDSLFDLRRIAVV